MDYDSLLGLENDVQAAIKQLDINGMEVEKTQLEAEMAKPEFWNNQENAKTISKRHAKIEKKITTWRQLELRIKEVLEMVQLKDESLEDELGKEQAKLQKTFDSLHFNLMLSGPYDEHDAILSIHAGTGGTDAQDWAEMLERMYIRFCERMDWKVEALDRSTGDEAGIKHTTLRVEGDYAYGRLQSEHGVHRLVRLSPFNADNLRQTSFALVEVVPEIEEDIEVEIDENDLKIDVYRAGGHGGQSVNTTDSAVRITHEPTGIVVAIQNERSQLQNKQTALKILKGKLAQLKAEQRAEKLSDLKGPDVQAAWGNQIRNYVLHPYTMVKDTRTKFETSDANLVLDGKLEDFIEAYLKQKIST